MTKVQIEELQYFYLKYLHAMNKIRVLIKDANCIAIHIRNLENGTLTDVDLYDLCRGG